MQQSPIDPSFMKVNGEVSISEEFISCEHEKQINQMHISKLKPKFKSGLKTNSNYSSV